HFWKEDKVSYRVFSDNNSSLKELVATPRRDNISEEKWIVILQNLQDEDVKPLGWSLMRFCTDVGTLTRSLYLGFEELSDILP
ncbi:hypothetical protein Goari_014733, partial [Gossypium aridum]|nr:hypothetical protein [Gossypium aridum]